MQQDHLGPKKTAHPTFLDTAGYVFSTARAVFGGGKSVQQQKQPKDDRPSERDDQTVPTRQVLGRDAPAVQAMPKDPGMERREHLEEVAAAAGLQHIVDVSDVFKKDGVGLG